MLAAPVWVVLCFLFMAGPSLRGLSVSVQHLSPVLNPQDHARDVLAFAVVAGVVTRAATAAVAGEDLGVARSYRFGIGRTWLLLGVLLTTWLCTMLGAVLLIVPGVIVGVLLAVAVPALVVEGLGARAALSRSFDLARGQ